MSGTDMELTYGQKRIDERRNGEQKFEVSKSM